MKRMQPGTSTKAVRLSSLDHYDPDGHNPDPQNTEAKVSEFSTADSEPSEPDDWDNAEIDRSGNEQDWEAFLADDDERDPLPEEGDFWIDPDD